MVVIILANVFRRQQSGVWGQVRLRDLREPSRGSFRIVTEQTAAAIGTRQTFQAITISATEALPDPSERFREDSGSMRELPNWITGSYYAAPGTYGRVGLKRIFWAFLVKIPCNERTLPIDS